ncbi:MAG: TetR/AcrR family transcriptional regulator [Lachnospirales bacterium]
MKDTDLRVIKSKKNIKKAFLELMTEKKYQQITVKDIAQRALINRKTFYFHYETKEALYNEIAKEVTELINPSEILGNIQNSTKEGQRQIFKIFLSELKKNKDVCTVFLDDITNPGFHNMMREKISDALWSETEISKRIKGTNFSYKFLTDAYFAIFRLVIVWWLDSDSENPDDAIEFLFNFFSKEPLELLGIKYD